MLADLPESRLLKDLQLHQELPVKGLPEAIVARRQPFVPLPGFPVLARIPLLAAADSGMDVTAVEGVVIEGMCFAARQAGQAARRAPRIGDDRLAVTVRAYDRRARLRPTPRGAFAGVQIARVAGRRAELRLGGGHRARSTPSAGWLAAVADHALMLPGVLRRLTFTTSNLVRLRGRRMEHEQPARPGGDAPHWVTIRATDATTLILRVCEAGAAYATIVFTVRREWPTVPEPLIFNVLLEMVRGGFLITDLLPDSLNDDPVAHVLSRLPGGCDLRGPLSEIRGHLRAADRHPPGAADRFTSLSAALRLCDQLSRRENPICVDVAADADIVVPEALVGEAAEAAGLLWRLGHTSAALTDYHSRFLDRYGQGRFVSFLDVVDEVVGLGDIGAETEIDLQPMSQDRTTALAGLLADAVSHGRIEVVLDAGTIAVLEVRERHPPPPPGAEIYVRVLAASEDDRAAGRLHLAAYLGGTQDAGSSVGRFASLLPDAKWSALGALSTTALVAEVVVRPRKPELATVAAPTGFADVRIPVGLAPRDGDLRLDDLVLVSDGHRLELWSRERGRRVLPVLYSRIGPNHLPPEARLLQQLGLSGCRPWCAWSWGPLENTAFQPRVRYRQTILAPARWLLPPSLTSAAGSVITWRTEVERWLTTTTPPVPQIVVAEDADRQLPLDLRDERDRELLRRYVRRGLDAVTEQPGGPSAIQAVVPGPAGWHVLELVVALACTAPVPPPGIPNPRVITARSPGDGYHLPGSEWLSLALLAPARHHNDILLELAALVSTVVSDVDRWFWLRYTNSAYGPHLRVRFTGKPAVLAGEVLPAVSVWCSGLVAGRLASGFTVEPYEQEIERYGGPAAIQAAERVFAADSELVLAALACTSDSDQRLVLAALSAVAVARSVADGSDAALDGRRVDRSTHRRLRRLRDLVRTAARDGSAVIAPTHPAWAQRQLALAAYRDRVPEARRADCASSVIHMHANRLLGDSAAERTARALAADILAREAR